MYLLTDGCVEDTEKVIDLIWQYNGSASVHTIGIGSGVSTELVIESAHAGWGSYNFVNDEAEGLSKCVIQAL